MSTGSSFNPNHEISDQVRSKFFIDGVWKAPSGSARLDLISPITEELFLRVPEAAPADIDNAVEAARNAFDNGPWPRMSPVERSRYIAALGEELARREPILSKVWTAQVGAPVSFTEVNAPLIPTVYSYYASLGETYPFVEDRALSAGYAEVRQEPVGVAAIIVPWNAPLILMSFAIAPALLAGCTIVLKPAPEAPLEALLLAECAQTIGLPPGVLNVLPAGRETGDYLIRHKGVDKIAFTGSGLTGRHIASVAGESLKRVGLELGGKSAAVFLEDADLNLAFQSVVPVSMFFSGQGCLAFTRLLVPRSRHQEITAAYSAAVGQVRVGDPWDPQTQLGPLSIRRQLDRVLGYIEKGKEAGARLVRGGGRDLRFAKGYYVEPTIFDDVQSDMVIAQEEIFGPVVCVIPYDDEEDAVRIANASTYGLNGSVHSKDSERAANFARKIRTGNITVNGFNLQASIPYGGFKQSGYGRVGGVEGLHSYVETKAIYMPDR